MVYNIYHILYDINYILHTIYIYYVLYITSYILHTILYDTILLLHYCDTMTRLDETRRDETRLYLQPVSMYPMLCTLYSVLSSLRSALQNVCNTPHIALTLNPKP